MDLRQSQLLAQVSVAIAFKNDNIASKQMDLRQSQLLAQVSVAIEFKNGKQADGSLQITVTGTG